MELFFTRYKRVFITLGMSVLFWISGEVCSHYELYFTCILFIVTSISFPIYLLLFWILNRKKNQAFSEGLTKWEWKIIPVLSAIFCLLGIAESYPKRPDFTAVFSLFLVYTVLFAAVLIRNYYLQKKGVPLLSKSFINKLIFWSFAIGIGRILILIDEYGDTDALAFIAIFYFPLLIILILRWVFKQTRAILTLKNEKAKTELLHLKSQVNPHFFFNMLNNLYGLVGTDAKKAQDLILKLSDMMRYSIYEGEKELVTLEEEMDYLKNYIELHKMRYHKEIDIQFKNEISENHKVMPLLFIILLENAFKHGVENLREDAYVNVHISTEGNDIQFTVENNFDSTTISKNPGIGLKNLKRRLELGYLNKHSLSFTSTNDIYKVDLTISKL
ncbi:MAG: sensor histidine kinase [Psychroserpens sp.]|uniref:sensor histidine kinase n=1 Tax=Psychroserpens sp. TaxID=2020870 RepID=UPI00300351DB